MTSWIPSAGASLWYEETGSGPTVVLAHAGIADSTMWDPLVARLADAYRLVRYDLRGYGRSPLPPGAFSHVEDLTAVIRATGDGPVHLVGASLGGRVALDLALDSPELVQSLVLLGSPVSGFEPDVEPPALWDELVRAHRAGDVPAMADLETRMWLADPDATRLPPALLDGVRAANAVALANERSGIADETEPAPPAAERLASLAVPLLVVVGDLDQPDILLAADLLAAEVPDVRRLDLVGVAHLPALEVPEHVATAVHAFANQHQGAVGPRSIR